MKLDLTGLTLKAKIFFVKQRRDELERALKREDTLERKMEFVELDEYVDELEAALKEKEKKEN